ncbi:Pyruvate dehydrogenase phosphatase regulatory subunit, mitochondrial [Armadillidium nasatum]|uniref:Pyruvate dehydrogenase phosphatase regulatory subunit, mitochondrial n=1 Tax=Armadillidium nasatum TaxID=96803 RepID=A0A5N5THR2_9CRUS|nr:Pyruvate dehydrogenase phosphatase regulatory subunit, mitochondrial [Armadillidium nasatum]
MNINMNFNMFKKLKLKRQFLSLNKSLNLSKVGAPTVLNFRIRKGSTCSYLHTSSQNYSLSNEKQDVIPPIPTHSYAPYACDLFPIDKDLPKKVKVVICGGGIFGTSLAYHLANMGWAEDTLLIEQGKLGGPTSWRGSGFLGGVKLSKPEMDILRSSLSLVQALDKEGHDVGWKKCGSLHLARTANRLTHFRRMKAIAEARGTECFMLNPSEIESKCNVINTSDLEGALWVPNDGVCDLYKLCLTLLRESHLKGTHIVEDCTLHRIINQEQKIVAVQTSKGLVECDIFVNAGGTWSRKVGQMSEPFVKVPIHPAEHYYLYTQPLEGIDFVMPAIRDPDGFIYMREYNGGVLAGTFEKIAKPAFEDGILPDKWHLREQPVDWDQFHPALQELLHRAPFLHSALINQLHNSADGFSPDSRWIVGQVPEYKNYFVAAGMRSGGSNAGTGIGKMVAEWIVNDYPPMDAYELDILRFLPAHNNRKFLRDRVVEVPGIHYSNEYPFMDFNTGRCIRMSPMFPKLKAAGGVFNQVMGYERPSYFITDGVEAPFRAASTPTWTKPSWFGYTAREYLACRETCGLLDYSSFAKFDIWSRGEEVVNSLQNLCSNDVDIPVGGICHSGMQNIKGGYENDCSLARISPNHYMMIAPSIQQTRCLTWLRRNLPSDGSVIISDVTSKYTAICLMGPKARDILSEITSFDLSPKAFPFLLLQRNRYWSCKWNSRYELNSYRRYALHVYDNLIEAGEKHGMLHAGYYAMRSLRVEKFYAFWGQDLDSSTTPLECGRVFRTKLDKNIDFLGRAALEKQKKEGVKRLYVHLTLEDHDPEIDPWPFGGEPIYRNGKFVGVCLGFIRNVNSETGIHEIVTPEYVMDGYYEVDVAGIKHAANASLRSPNLPSKFPDITRDRYMATRT